MVATTLPESVVMEVGGSTTVPPEGVGIAVAGETEEAVIVPVLPSSVAIEAHPTLVIGLDGWILETAA